MDIFIELLFYTIYMYLLVIFAIVVKPNVLILSLFWIYTILSTLFIWSYDKCREVSNIFKYIFITLYSFFCVAAIYMIHVIFHSYHNYRFVLLGLPVAYFINVRVGKAFLGCEDCYVEDLIHGMKYFSKNVLKS